VWNWPVLPVMPWVMTRVFLSIRMLMMFSFGSWSVISSRRS
jgi:hypothetical protein